MTQKEKIKHCIEILGENFNIELKTLDASGTGLKEIPVMPELKTLYASGTGLKEIPVMPKLEYLDARGTGLKETLFISKSIGSRYDVTEYWIEADEIICGCFKGTLSVFEKRVKDVYSNSSNEFRKQYLIFIKECKLLKNTKI